MGQKLSPRKPGTVVRNKDNFRVQVKLNGIVHAGPARSWEADANADLDLARACREREEIPTLLGRLRDEARMARLGLRLMLALQTSRKTRDM